jgi:hypothetical protein
MPTQRIVMEMSVSRMMSTGSETVGDVVEEVVGVSWVRECSYEEYTL